VGSENLHNFVTMIVIPTMAWFALLSLIIIIIIIIIIIASINCGGGSSGIAINRR
jgi:hypothetical protein